MPSSRRASVRLPRRLAARRVARAGARSRCVALDAERRCGRVGSRTVHVCRGRGAQRARRQGTRGHRGVRRQRAMRSRPGHVEGRGGRRRGHRESFACTPATSSIEATVEFSSPPRMAGAHENIASLAAFGESVASASEFLSGNHRTTSRSSSTVHAARHRAPRSSSASSPPRSSSSSPRARSPSTMIDSAYAT